MAITGIPDYTGATPIEYSIRCVCGLRYLAFTGAVIASEIEVRVRERAAQMSVQFVDVRETPFMSCECGEVLNFIEDSCAMVM